MAYIVETKQTAQATSNPYTVGLPSHVANDLLLFLITQDGGNTELSFGTTTATVTSASPAVFTYSGADIFSDGDIIVLTGTMPTGLTNSATQKYFVKSLNAGANTFQVSTSLGGASVNTTGSGTVTIHLHKAESNGWTMIGFQSSAGSQGVNSTWAYKIAASGAETSPVVTGGAGLNKAATSLVVRDADTSTPFGSLVSGTDYVRATTNGATTLASGSLTTGANSCLLLYSWSLNGNTTYCKPKMDDLLSADIYTNSNACQYIGFRQQGSASTSAPAVTAYASASNGQQSWVLAIRNKANGALQPDIRFATDDIAWYGSFNSHILTPTWQAAGYVTEVAATALVAGTKYTILTLGTTSAANWISAGAVSGTATGEVFTASGATVGTGTAAAAINTIAVNSVAPTITATSGGTNLANSINGLTVSIGQSTNLAYTTWSGGSHAIPSTNLTGKVFHFLWGFTATPTQGSITTDGLIVVFSDGAEWIAYQVVSNDKGWATVTGYPAYVACGVATHYAKSSGNINWGAITRLAYLYNRGASIATQADIYLKNAIAFDYANLTGGGSARPVTFADYGRWANAWGVNAVAVLQGSAQVLGKTSLEVGDGGTSLTYFDSSASSFEYPQAWSATRNSNWQMDWNATEGAVDLSINAGASDTIYLRASVSATDTAQGLAINSASSTSATYSFNGESFVGWLPTWKTGVNVSGATLSECGEIDAKGSDWTDCTIAKTTSTDAAFAFSEDGGSMTRCTIDVTGTSAAYHLELGTAVTAVTLADVTFTGTPGTDKIHVKATTGTVTITTSGTTSIVAGDVTSEGATVSIVAPTVERGIAFSGLQTGTSIQVFTTATQTKLYGDNSTAGSTFSFDDATAGTLTVDYTIQKVGYLPIRVTGVVLTGAVGGQLDVTVTQIPDRAYVASSGLTYGTTAVVTVGTNPTTNPGTKTFQLTTASTGQNWYSFWVEQWIDKGTATGEALANVEFPLAANGPNSFTLNDGWTFSDGATSIAFLSRDGLRYLNTSDVLQKSWAAILTSGVPAGAIVRYQQTDGGTTVDAANTGEMDQLVQIYDVGVYDYRSYLVLKVQEQGYDQAESNVVTLYGNLEDQLYVVGLTPMANGVATGDPALTITITDHGASPVTWNGKDFSITITDNASASTGTNIMRELRYNFETGGTYQGKDAFNWHDLVQTNGADFKTVRGIVYGDVGATLKGVRVVTNGGTDPHPDFTLFTADDGTTFSPAVSADISITSMPTAAAASRRLQVTNETAATAAIWQANTTYTAGAVRLRTAGVGVENTAGLYLRCTTAGASAGVEPTWNTTPGGTTTDNTAVWTTYKVLFYDTDPAAASYATTYTDGNEFLAGETVGIRFAEMDAGTSFKTFDTTTIAASSGFSVAVNEDADDTYAANALDGSTFEATFSPNFTDDYIVLDSNTDFSGKSAYAYFCYTLTSSNGMYQFWGGVTALDTGNYRIESDILNLYFDETTGFVKQTDDVRIFRKDGTRPALDPTTGGSGIEINWRTPVSVISTGGSALTPTESAYLLALPSASTTATAVHDEVIEGTLTFRQITRIKAAALAGSSNKAGNNITFKGVDGTTDRIVGTFDAQNNRTGAVLDGS